MSKTIIMILALICSATMTSTFANCEQTNVKRIVDQSIGEIQEGMGLTEHYHMSPSEDCQAEWIRELFPSLKGEIVKTTALKLDCGIAIDFDSEREMKNFFADYLNFNKYRDHYIAFDFLADLAVPVCGRVK